MVCAAGHGRDPVRTLDAVDPRVRRSALSAMHCPQRMAVLCECRRGMKWNRCATPRHPFLMQLRPAALSVPGYSWTIFDEPGHGASVQFGISKVVFCSCNGHRHGQWHTACRAIVFRALSIVGWRYAFSRGARALGFIFVCNLTHIYGIGGSCCAAYICPFTKTDKRWSGADNGRCMA